MNYLILLYSILYLSTHIGLLLANPNKRIQWNMRFIIYRVWLLLLDLFIIVLFPFINNWYLINSYPVWATFALVFYYISRHCLRNLPHYQYMVHLYHPETNVYYLGQYYCGIMYSTIDFALKGFVVATCLRLNIYLAIQFLLLISALDTWFYYNNISDNTSETFHKMVGVIFKLIHNKSQ